MVDLVIQNKTYSFCIALTTARENGADDVFALIVNDRFKVCANMQFFSNRQILTYHMPN